MAYIPGYTYDIFLSYAHIDNLKLSGQTHGWIEHFYTDLYMLLSRRIGSADAIKIWWDNKKLDGTMLFNDSIAEGIRSSAVILCLTSPGYLESGYCQQELDLFYKKAQAEPMGLKAGERSRIVNVLLNNIPYAEWPKELSGTTGFSFNDATSKDDLGDLLIPGSSQFQIQLQDFRDAIIKLIFEMRRLATSSGSKETDETGRRETKKEEIADAEKFTVFFSDVADTLRSTRKRIISELEKTDCRIVYDIPPPFEASAHETAVREKLETADLAVHLLDQFPGREIEGEEIIWYPQKQALLGLNGPKPQLIWVPAEANLEEVEETQYRDFMQDLESGRLSSKKIEYIRGAKSELTQQIMDLINKIKSDRPAPPGGSLSVLLDTHYNDQLYALELSKSLLENEIQPFINPQEDNPRSNIKILEDRISQVRKLVFLYGKVSRDWVLERMSAALQIIVTHNYPIESFYVYMVPPHKDPAEMTLKQRLVKVDVINNSDSPQLDMAALTQFLKNLKAVA